MFNVSPDDIGKRMQQPLSASQVETVQTLIEDAEDMLRVEFSDIVQRFESGALAQSTLTRVICSMVKRAIQNPADGVASQSQSAGPFSVSNTYSNPSGNLYLTSAERTALAGAGAVKVRMGWAI